ncbi:MAG TPA: S8 family serine peptidase [Ideonella sp.]|nr:S8 family serine peptidase [Ideonella sp.]
MTSRPFLRVAGLALSVGLPQVAGAAAAPASASLVRTYLVQLADAPAASYDGRIPGYAATRPAPGAKLGAQAPQVLAYRRYLAARRAATLASLGAVPVVRTYEVAFNGFAARLSAAEAARLRADPRVARVSLDVPAFVSTNRTPAFLGLSTARGLWSRTDAGSRSIKGEDVVIGMVDTGIWPEDPSFSDRVDADGKPIASNSGTVVYGPPPAGWSGTCASGPGFDAARHCNHKLIGARFFIDGFNASSSELMDRDYASPRDGDGHGSHTSATAGGNQNVDARNGPAIAGVISGIAPRARIAVYKACWIESTQAQAVCYGADQVAAIDQAVADGVDVINFSISGTRTDPLDPTQQAFLAAADAGVFVAAAAGNEGPGNTVAHPSPWVTSVAASTHDRRLRATATLGDGTAWSGVSIQPGLPVKPLILSTQAARNPPFNDRNKQARLCNFNTLDPAKAAGKIVVCDGGTYDPAEKSREVLAAGGAGMLLLTEPGGRTDEDSLHHLPTIQLPETATTPVRAYAATEGASVVFGPAANEPGKIAPVMASFSSRGPNLATVSVLKPDLTAPGVDILAGSAYPLSAEDHAAVVAGTLVPPTGAGLNSGTSMAAPHVAGVAALMKQLRPSWSPAAIKSALMTAAGAVRLADGTADTDRWGYGAGHLNPNGAAAVELVYDAGGRDYAAFLCGLDEPRPAGCNPARAIKPYNLNLPSITGDIVGRTVFKRKMTNLGPTASTYVAKAKLAGFDVAVTPSSLTLAPGQTDAFEVSVTRTSAAVGDWTFGELTWRSGKQQVKSPLTGRAMLMAAPAELMDTRATGKEVVGIVTGYDGSLSASPAGLVPATRQRGSVATYFDTCFDVAVPADTLHVRAALFNSETQGGDQSDLDLELRSNGVVVASSGSPTSDERLDHANPAAGSYQACVIGYAPTNGKAAFWLSTWVVTAGVPGAGGFRAAVPPKATVGGSSKLALGWSGLAARTRYLGAVQFKDGTQARIGQTLVAIDTDLASAVRGAGGRKAMKTAVRR